MTRALCWVIGIFFVVQFATGAFTPGGVNVMPEFKQNAANAWNAIFDGTPTLAGQPDTPHTFEAPQEEISTQSQTAGGHTKPPYTVADGVVARVIDGDTIKLQDGRTIRILQIDTPESTNTQTLECGGRDASAFVQRLLPVGTRVHVQHDPNIEKQDRYGRTLAYPLRAKDHLNIAVKIVEAGWAAPYYYKGRRGMYAPMLDAAREGASNQRKGIWSLCSVRGWSPIHGVNASWS